jgi:diguanylate cyclase (GGDEF)-like protein
LSPLPRFSAIRFRWLGLVLLLAGWGGAGAAERWDALTLPDFQIIERDGRPLEGPVRSVTQDLQGFIWITADGALWRWDGYQLKKAGFQDIASDSPELPEILIAKSDPIGVIWVGTSAGLFRLDRDRLILERVNHPVLNGLSPEFLAFEYSQDGNRVYLASEHKLYVLQNGVLRKVHSGRVGNRIHALLLATDRRLWIGSNDGLHYMAGDQVPQAVPALAQVRISALYQASNGGIWIGTAKDGIFRIDDDGSPRLLPLPETGEHAPWIYDIAELRAGEYWFATFGNGLLVYDSRTATFKPIRKERMLESKLLDNDVWTLFRDRSGSLWIGTRTGINIMGTTHAGLRHIPAGLPGTRLSDGLIYAMETLPDGRIAVGTGTYGLDLLDSRTGLSKHLAPGSAIGAARIPETAIEAMQVLPDNRLLVGSNWDTLSIDLSLNQADVLQAAGRAVDAYTSDMTLFDGSLWLSGTDGLWRVDDGKAVNVMSDVPGDQRVTRLLADGGSLWIGTWKGLKRLDMSAASTPVIVAVNDILLNQRYINALYRDPQGRIWVGTYGGGLLFNDAEGMAAGKAWSHIGEQQGLPGNKVAAILSDAGGNVWVGTENGLARIDPKTLSVAAIRPEAGASAAPYESAVRTADGDLLFGGSNGITVVQPGMWRTVSNQAPLVFSEIRSGNGNPLAVSHDRNGNPAALRLPPDIDSVELEFAALDFINAPHLHYRYRLLGRDSEWRRADTELRTVLLANLPPDEYRLEIAYSQDGKRWSDKPLTLPISVLPAWYEQPWVRMLLALSLLAILIMLQRWWSSRVRRRQAALEATVYQRTAELETANDLLKQQALTIREASLTDPLTGMHNRRFFTQHIDSEAQLAVRRYKTGSDLPIDQADLVFFLVDIDQFKRINDRQGHAAGDAVLIEMRYRLQSVFRGSDFLIRWGGEEFLAVARGASRARASELAERIRTAVNGTPFRFNGNGPIEVTCSVGFAPFPFLCGRPEALSWKETLALADAALYAAKNAGRNAWVGFNGRDEPMGSLLSILRASPEAALQTESIGVSRSTGEGVI